MKRQMRNRSGLLSRVSTLAILAAAGAFGSAQQAQANCTGQLDIDTAPTTINADANCAVVDSNLPAGNVTNNANLGPGDGESGFFVGNGGIINGILINEDTISGGEAGGDGFPPTGALTIGDGGDITGGVQNNGQISSENGNGINLGFQPDGIAEAAMTGDIINTGGIHGGVNGIGAYYGTMSGQLVNDEGGVITGGDAAVYIDGGFTSWTGGIVNRHRIRGDTAGIQVGFFGGKGNDVIFSGGILNEFGAEISSLNGPAILAGGSEFSGGIVNHGTITQRDLTAATSGGSFAGVGLLISAETFNDGIVNTGQVIGLGGPAIWVTSEVQDFVGNLGDLDTSNDGIVNSGVIDGADEGVLFQGQNFVGNITNSTTIHGDISGVDFSNTETNINAGDANAQFTNTGSITGGSAYGVRILGDNVAMDFRNTFGPGEEPPTPTISAGGEGDSVGVLLSANTWNGDVENDGSISGTAAGLVLGGLPTDVFFVDNAMGTFVGTVTNTGDISGSDYGVLATVENYNGDFVNEGDIFGADSETGIGVAFIGASSDTIFANKGSFDGTFSNTGSIDGGLVGLAMNFGSIAGGVSNGLGGVIDGGATGVAINAAVFDGNVTNSGAITGGTAGLIVDVGSFEGSILNTGYIEGGVTGLYVEAGTFIGTITNEGTIVGGAVDVSNFVVGPFQDPGLTINVGTYTGDVVNNGTLSANSNALDVTISTLTGSIVNTGLIEATEPVADAVVLNVNNGATFINTDGGTIVGNVVLSDIVFSGKAAYAFIGEDGGIAGNIVGTTGFPGNNDTVVVQNGTHYFVQNDGGEAGVAGTASNLASFTVEDGGFAVMGALEEGDTEGTGYAFSNVDVVNVNDGGTLYIDKATTLNVDDTYNQAEFGTLEFYLGAPAGISSATGTIAAGAGDYGQLIVDGTANLDGVIAGFLDPDYASANSSLEAVVYNDVIIADNVEGDFTTLALINSNSLFELTEVVDPEDGFDTVDLTVTRTAIGHIGDIGSIITQTGSFAQTVAGQQSGIGSGSCGMAGPGWCFNRFAQNEPGATQVMTDATPGDDPFAWLRTGVRRVGETSAWGRAIGAWGDTDGDATHAGSDFDSYGAIVGIDHVFSQTLMAGVAAQWTTTDIDFDGKQDNADVDSFEVGGYASYGDTRLYLNANASVIFHNIDVTRFAPGGQAFGDYDGTTISAYAELGKIFETYDGWRIQPLVALNYAHLDTDSYSETGTATTLLNVFDADYDSLKGMAGVRLAYPIEMESGRKIVPEARVVWAHEFMDDQSSFLATTNLDPVTVNLITGQEISRDTIILGTGLTAPLSNATTLFVDYDAGLNEDVTTHSVSAGLRTRW